MGHSKGFAKPCNHFRVSKKSLISLDTRYLLMKFFCLEADAGNTVPIIAWSPPRPHSFVWHKVQRSVWVPFTSGIPHASFHGTPLPLPFHHIFHWLNLSSAIIWLRVPSLFYIIHGGLTASKRGCLWPGNSHAGRYNKYPILSRVWDWNLIKSGQLKTKVVLTTISFWFISFKFFFTCS